MRKQLRQFTFIAGLACGSLILAGCSNSAQQEFEDLPSQTRYAKGQDYLQQGDYQSAIRYLDSVDGHFRAGQYSEQTLLSLMYSNYKIGEYYKAIDYAERIARTYPELNSLDYVYYVAALSYARLSDNYVQNLFRVNASERALEASRNAYGSFQRLVNTFPQSKYAADAHQWMAYLYNRIAEHDLAIVKFYDKRDAYVAVSNRVQQMLQYYPDTQATKDALPYLKNALNAMGLHDSAAKVDPLIDAAAKKQYHTPKQPEFSEQF